MMALRDNVTGCWNPAAGATGFTLLDYSGRSNHGTFNGMDVSDWRTASPPKQTGFVLNGDATNNRVATALRLPTSNMTYGGWVLSRALTTTADANRPFGEADSLFGFSGCSLLLRSNGPYVVMRGGTTSDFSASTTVANNVWYLFVVTLGSRPEVYQNGVLVGSGTGTTITSRNVGFQILNDDIVNLNKGINGLVGEVCVWNRALTAAEILQWYIGGNGAVYRAMTKRQRTYGFVAAGFRPYWAQQRTQLIGGGLR
jgi:hypothetical protein